MESSVDSGVTAAATIAETERLYLRELIPSDVPQLAVALGDAEVMRYSLKGVHSEDDTRAFVDWCIASYRDKGFGPWALVAKDQPALAGFCGLSTATIDGVAEVHVGYRLARPFWGRGLATEAVGRVLRYGFEELGMAAVAAIVEPENTASLRVLEKTGFHAVGCSSFHGRSVRLYRCARSAFP